MKRRPTSLAALALVLAALPFALASACTLSGTGLPPALDAGFHDVGAPDAMPVPTADGGFTLLPNPPVDQGSLAPGQLLVTASGESLALKGAGYDFPARNPGNPVFADGWQVQFSRFIVTFDKVSLWENPDRVPTDQSQHGSLVAEIDGPWAVDLSQDGNGFPYVAGKEQGEKAVAFAVIADQNQNGGAAFPRDGTRFAVGFSAVVATPGARNVNLGPDALGAYQSMIDRGCVALYLGTATWKGDQKPGLCATPGASGDAAVSNGTGTEPEFAALPTKVDFDLCFKPRTQVDAGTVDTSYVNCDNQDNDPGPPLNGEPHQRGVAFKGNTYTVGEITFHTDHPFWESTLHDTPAHFNQFAARAVGADAGPDAAPVVHLEDTLGVDYRAFTDKQGAALPWRICDPAYQNPSGVPRVGQMAFNPQHVSPTCSGGDPKTGFCDYFDFAKYDQSTQGHYNGADGLCFVQRNYPSPP